ncbi:hypothetical protein ACQCN2_14470 [Brevibacillus ginsengisoli]|uniref:hypothetical protein n=1 Tax=Brevibacillus ginsengisoli TaxID=363854 RepID=UPI003CE6DE6F
MEERIDHQHVYLLQCQLPSGTFRLSPTSDRINPYFTNLGLLALIELGDYEPVKQHLNWYMNHLSSDGYVNDYRLIKGQEINTKSADSEDSYHATFFSLLLAYIQLTEEIEWLQSVRDTLLRIYYALVELQQKDGLTWAKHSYKVKYLMDNCEVYQGLVDASELFAILGETHIAEEAQARAKASQTGIQGMYNPSKRTFAMYDSTYPVWSKWYPDATSQMFPIVYHLIAPDSKEATYLYQQLTTHFPRFDEFETGDPYPWMFIGLAAAQMNDWERVRRMLNQAWEQYIQGPKKPYWLLHESGRYIQLALALLAHDSISSFERK